MFYLYWKVGYYVRFQSNRIRNGRFKRDLPDFFKISPIYLLYLEAIPS